MTNTRGTVGVLLLAFVCFASTAGAAPPDDAWNLLKTLIGNWQAETGEPQPTQVSYQLTSNGSAILETVKDKDGGPFMITIYHRDGTDLMATHYCAIGNQPRMRAKAPTAADKKIEFRFVDVTNLKAPGAAHISGVLITFKDADHVDQAWSHRENGKDGITMFRLTRAKPVR